MATGRRSQEVPDGSTALVLTGGGVTGGVYQIGALRALDLLLVGSTVNDFDVYVGTSCGAFVASLVANGARPEDLMVLLGGGEVDGYEPLDLGALLKPNVRDYVGSAAALPARTLGLVRDLVRGGGQQGLIDVATKLGDLAPGGFYSMDGLVAYLNRQLGRDGWSNDFRTLSKPLHVVATDLDTCEPVVFGDLGWDDVPVSTAVAASAALPVVYRGVEVRGREFVDGALRAFANVRTAIDRGATLVVVVNPVVPFENQRLHPNEDGRERRPLSDRGLADVASQMFRCLVWSAFHDGFDAIRREHPEVDFVLVEPARDDELMFSTQVMNVSDRVRIARHGFESVTVRISSDFDRHREVFARHGIEISRRGVVGALRDLQREETAEGGLGGWRRLLERR